MAAMPPAAGRRVLAVVLATPVLAGCAGATATTPDTPQPSLSARAHQTRPDAAAGGRFQVVVENTGTVPFTVTSVQLVSAGFTAEAPAERDTAFTPGRRISLPTPYGAARCDEPAEPAEVALGLVVAGQERARAVPAALGQRPAAAHPRQGVRQPGVGRDGRALARRPVGRGRRGR